MKTFLICNSENHAEVVDALILSRLADVDGNRGSCWSGVWAKRGFRKDTYGVLWANPASSLFGEPITDENPDGDPLLTLATETIDAEGESDWSLVLPPEPVEEPL
jgi:hypothetical protein